MGTTGGTYAAVYRHSSDVPLRQGQERYMSLPEGCSHGSSCPHMSLSFQPVSACALGCQKPPAGQFPSCCAHTGFCPSLPHFLIVTAESPQGPHTNRNFTSVVLDSSVHAKLAQEGFNSHLRPGMCDLPGDAPQNPTLSQATSLPN